MDETEQYKQRLEAIAEKRRLQEEQDRARREQEDERLRQQQLKRKSLRDQWLMEGTPLSPTSPNNQNPYSSVFSSQTQDMEKPIDKLQPDIQRLAEEQDTVQKLHEAVKVAEAGAEEVQDVRQNGQNDATRPETSDDDVKKTQSPPEIEAAVVLTNGQGHLEANTNHNNSEQSVLNQNGPARVFEGVDSIKLEPEISVTEAASGPNVSINEAEEEGTLMMRAEPVFITDEGGDVPDDLSSQEDQQESDKASLPQSDSGDTGEEDMELVVETESAPEPLPESEISEATELTVEAQPTPEEEDVEGAIKSCTNDEEETKTNVQEEKMEDPVCVQLQSLASALEGATVAPVPVYTEVPPSAPSPEAEVHTKGEAPEAPVEEKAEVKVEDPAFQLGHFQEVPLTETQDNQKKEAEPGEKEPLLMKAEASAVNSEPAGSTTSPVATETPSPATRSQGDENQRPKRKTCQCCSVM
ncbi:paralemmin-3 [Kryptolebias marmoratus]|uniref:Paralemmin-3-like n=1 Tax=Kryptolebias marmoratus TaxID=37003 RepID=A0A3Q3B7D0_KRYMA|nr:paralemmin-3 [Kryptolebias marmoratus]XP_017285992.1 paralemmin-3 [Kryptolebias marmoratus]XP_017285994.1 paralemmin-3 [Kryptolebias marmoratus]